MQRAGLAHLQGLFLCSLFQRSTMFIAGCVAVVIVVCGVLCCGVSVFSGALVLGASWWCRIMAAVESVVACLLFLFGVGALVFFTLLCRGIL